LKEISMGSSPLDPANPPPTPDRSVRKGHDTRTLGPSDSSDSGSDLVGARDVEQAGLDADSDRQGTGEFASPAREGVPPDGGDIGADRVERIPGEPPPQERRSRNRAG
jgi:hypothetical protein